jgi:hypothetical protein
MANRTTTRPLAPIEKKAVAGPTAAVLGGYIVWLVFTIWPNLKTYVTPEAAAQMPVVVGGILAALAAYVAPHTSRPDLPSVQPAPAQALGGQGGQSSFRSGTGQTHIVVHGGDPVSPSGGAGGGGVPLRPGPDSTPEAGGAWPAE